MKCRDCGRKFCVCQSDAFARTTDPKQGGLVGEVTAKHRALDAHEDRKGRTLDALRAEMTRICITEGRYVDANDARQILELWGEETGPWMGALFRTKGWRNTGEVVKSTAVGSHARILWRYDLAWTRR